jgi:ATP-dependent RNA helicase DeaD
MSEYETTDAENSPAHIDLSLEETAPEEGAVEPEGLAVEEMLTGFDALGLNPELLGSLRALGYEEPTPIQRETIPLLLQGHDLVGQAATGTGKTAAFALPIVERIAARTGARRNPVALVLVPTRELAMQVSEAFYKYGHSCGTSVVPVYGGQHISRQLDALRRGVDVVVATPGRAIDHIRRGSMVLTDVSAVVLDEADEMLDMGFAEDLELILEAVPQPRQTVLFSATMPPRIDAIARRHLKNPQRVKISAAKTEPGEAPKVRQGVYVVQRQHKAAALGRILDIESPGAAIVFCRTRGEVDQLTETLNGRGYRAEALHGGMDQAQRDRVMGRLRSGTAELLVATDVAARGLDIDSLTHVVNFDVPSAPEAYVHRIGRVGRAGREGVAITLAEPRELRLLANIERLTKHKIGAEKVPSVADLRARQVDQTVRMLSSAIAETEGEEIHDEQSKTAVAQVIERLLADHDALAVARVAVRLLHESSVNAEDEREIPDATPKVSPKGSAGRDSGRDSGRDGGKKFGDRGARHKLSDSTATGQVWVGAGKTSNVRPQDLVGAIANETSLTGRQIGGIRVLDHYSVVEVPAGSVDEVIGALNQTMLRGKKVTARRYEDSRRK